MVNLQFNLTRAVLLFVGLFFVANALTVHAQNPDAVADLAARINRERTARGLAPLALDAKLTAAAQGHADDVARAGRTNSPQEGHIGSDGSTVFDRVARTGYGAYSWGRRLGEDWAWYHSGAEAMAMWMDSAPHRNNILHPLYREMGIGVASTGNGTFVYVIDFGVQPNVLPIFINDGASEAKSLDVKITLTSEEVMPNGDGDNIGRPVQVMISNTADFAGAKWQPFAPTINWTLAPSGGTKTVYVKYRDAKGRTATASNSIVVSPAATPTITATRATPTRMPTRVTPLPAVVVTAAPTETPIVAPTDISHTEMPIATAVVTISATETAALTPTRSISSSDSSETAALPDFGLMSAVGVSVIMFALIARSMVNR
jgi:uncharacterized protein YkwD